MRRRALGLRRWRIHIPGMATATIIAMISIMAPAIIVATTMPAMATDPGCMSTAAPTSDAC